MAPFFDDLDAEGWQAIERTAAILSERVGAVAVAA